MRSKKIDGTYSQDTVLQYKSVSLVAYADYINILGRCLGSVMETYLELDAVKDVRLPFNTSETEALTQTQRKQDSCFRSANEKTQNCRCNCMYLGPCITGSCDGFLGANSDC
jgi:hypothetical protein